jgi:octaprenyl-diphosphate synthase
LHQVTQRGNLRLTEAEYFDIVEGKTAALTECCTKLGAIYAGADVETIHGLAEYGRSLGIAFQIADDLLDLVGMESNTGKTLGTDFAQQKLTLPLIHALDRLPTSRAAELRALLLECTSPGESLVGLLREANAIAYARNKADEFARTAREALIPLPESPYKTALLSFADWSVRREH